MGIETAKLHYDNAKEKAGLVKVLKQPEEIVKYYLEAAEEMKAAGAYENAPQMEQEYRQKAVQAEKEGKEFLYQKACRRMGMAQDDAGYRLVAEMFRRVSGYKDADRKAEECELLSGKMKERKQTKNIGGWVITILILALLITAIFFHERSLLEENQQEGSVVSEIVVSDTASV